MEYAVPSRAAISATDAPAGACVGCAPALRVGGERFGGDFVYERGSLAVIVPVQLRRIDVCRAHFRTRATPCGWKAVCLLGSCDS